MGFSEQMFSGSLTQKLAQVCAWSPQGQPHHAIQGWALPRLRAHPVPAPHFPIPPPFPGSRPQSLVWPVGPLLCPGVPVGPEGLGAALGGHLAAGAAALRAVWPGPANGYLSASAGPRSWAPHRGPSCRLQLWREDRHPQLLGPDPLPRVSLLGSSA